jgi:hypothetical protein
MARSGFGRTYEAYWSGVKGSIIGQDVMRRAGQEVGRRMVEMNLRRLDDLRNSDGSRMDALTPRYKRFKIGKGLKGVRDTRLTGELRKDIRATVGRATQSGGEVTIPVSLDITSSSQIGKITGLSTGRLGKHGRAKPIDVIGIYNAGTAEGRQQRRELVRIASDVMRIAAGRGKFIDV